MYHFRASAFSKPAQAGLVIIVIIGYLNNDFFLNGTCFKYNAEVTNYFRLVFPKGHNQLLEIRLLEKSARHNFIIARQHSSNNYFSCQLLESS